MQHSDTQQGPTSGLRGLTRRRAVRIVAAVAGLPLMIAAVRATAPAGRLFDWQGEVLGAFAELSLWHTDEAAARRAIRQVEGEIARYERIFGLARADSEITRLNAAGALTGPSPELRGLMEESRRFSVLSAGAFDISVQPLWRLYEAHFWSRSAVQDDVLARARDVARDLVDYRAIDIGAARIAFARPGMAVTLNSLAQGFVTDACADLLRNEGFATAFVDLGEVRALGRHPDGRPWRVGIRNPQAAGLMQANPVRADSAQTDSVQAGLVQAGPVRSGVAQTLDLEDTAMAVSGGYGTTFEPTGRFHHIFDPHIGESAHALLDATVVGPRAAAANGLSTALCVVGEERAAALIAASPGYRAILTRPDGTTVGFGAAAA